MRGECNKYRIRNVSSQIYSILQILMLTEKRKLAWVGKNILMECSCSSKKCSNEQVILPFTGLENIVISLIEHHADINIRDKNGDSPLDVVLKNGKII